MTYSVQVKAWIAWYSRALRLARRIDLLTLSGAIITVFLAPTGQAWWSMTGATTSKLLTIQVSPYFLEANAIGFSGASFTGALGSFTSLLLFLAVFALSASSFHRGAWWSKITAYFGLCVLSELYLSFLLMYHAAETALLGMYGILPPFSGTTHLPALIIGLDTKGYVQPLVTAGFSLPFYLSFLSLGLVGGSLILENLRTKREKPPQRGVAAVFT